MGCLVTHQGHVAVVVVVAQVFHETTHPGFDVLVAFALRIRFGDEFGHIGLEGFILTIEVAIIAGAQAHVLPDMVALIEGNFGGLNGAGEV